MLYWSRKIHSLYHMVDERPRKMSMVNWSFILGFARSKPHRHYFRYYRNWVMEKKKYIDEMICRFLIIELSPH